MFREAAESAAAVRRMLDANRAELAQLGETLRAHAPRAVITVARGSSDHAATYAKYLIETRTGLLASSAAPSISSVYGAKADLEGVLCLALSQSGASPDLLSAVAAARSAGALVVALVNAEQSPLSRGAHHTIALRAAKRRASLRPSPTSPRLRQSSSSLPPGCAIASSRMPSVTRPHSSKPPGSSTGAPRSSA